MNRNDLPDRRLALTALGAGALAAAIPSVARTDEPHKAKGNIKQSICRWCYDRIGLEKLAEEAKKIGYVSIELLPPGDILKVKKFGLTCAVMRCKSGIASGRCCICQTWQSSCTSRSSPARATGSRRRIVLHAA